MKRGDDDIRGSMAAHYAVTINRSKIDRVFLGYDESARADLVAFDLWTDDEQRLRRARWTTRLRALAADPDHPSPTTEEGMDTDYRETTTVDLWDYGVDVKVVRPPDRDTCNGIESIGRMMEDSD